MIWKKIVSNARNMPYKKSDSTKYKKNFPEK